MVDTLNSTLSLVPPSLPQEPSHLSTGLKWAGIVLTLGLIGAAIGWFLLEKKQPGEAQPTEQTTTTQQAPEIIPGALFDNDKDLDGLDDAKEAEYGTSDLEFDTDGDGLRDIDEIEVWKTDPTKPDSDGDGFADGFEVLKGYNPAGPGTR